VPNKRTPHSIRVIIVDDDIAQTTLTLVAAPAIGSFLAVLVIRLPVGRPVLFGRSACDHCGTVLGWRDLVPLISGLLAGGKCRYCHTPVSRFHPLMELTALIPVIWSLTVLQGGRAFAGDVLGWQLIAIIAMTWRARSLPFALIGALLLSGLIAKASFAPHSGATSCLTAIGCGSGFAILSRYSGKPSDQSHADVPTAALLAGLGAWLSWGEALALLCFASSAALLSFWSNRIHGNTRFTQPIFRTSLVLVGWLLWLYGPLLIT